VVARIGTAAHNCCGHSADTGVGSVPVKLSDKLVRDLPAPAKGHTIAYDDGTRGLGVRVTAARRHTYVFRYRVKGSGAERLHTIGDAGRWEGQVWKPGAWTTKAAKRQAEELRRVVDGGGDPTGDLHAARSAPTVTQLAARFEEEHLPRLRPGTQDEYRRLLRIHILPSLGSKRVADLRHADADAMHRKAAEVGPYAANRAVAVLSKMLNLAIKWEMRSDNPARGIERAQEHKRERFLTGSEIARLSEALAAHSEQSSANAVRLLLLTGARRGEVLSAQWNQFDLATGLWTKPAATTKQKKEHRLPLSGPTLQLLTEMKANADRENERRLQHKLKPILFLFPGKEGRSQTDLKHFWLSVCRTAGLAEMAAKTDDRGQPVTNIKGQPVTGWRPTVRLHDLRHTHASILASLGMSLPIIGRLLGHTQAMTTARYAHLLDDPLRAATERLGAIVTGRGSISPGHVGAGAIGQWRSSLEDR
jgi:integrase